jgi:asparagine synthase (glutamine-hydrolysing)
MRYLEPDLPIHTFSFIAQGSPKNEEFWVDHVTEMLRCTPHKVVVQRHDLANDLDEMIRAQGEPFGSTSIYAQYRVYKLARSMGVTVTLDGQGADELLAGYFGYPEARLNSLLQQREFMTAADFLRQWSSWPGRGVRGAGIAVARALPTSMKQVLLHSRNEVLARKFLLSGSATSQRQVNLLPARDTHMPEGRALAARLRNALTQGDLSPLLRHGDRNSMHWSIESRVPFLTTRLAEFTLTLPEDLLVSHSGQTKSILRESLKGIVPKEILERKDKIGFETPERSWLEDLRPQLADWTGGLHLLPNVNQKEALKAVQVSLSSKLKYSSIAWRVINLSRWASVNFG